MTHNNLLISINRQISSYLDTFRKAFQKHDVNGGVREMHPHFQQMFEDLEKEPFDSQEET